MSGEEASMQVEAVNETKPEETTEKMDVTDAVEAVNSVANNAEADVADTNETGEKDTETVQPPKEDLKIYDQQGTILRSSQNLLVVKFEYDGQEALAIAHPGNLYINGSRALLADCPSEAVMKEFIREGETIHFDAAYSKPFKRKWGPNFKPRKGSIQEYKNQASWYLLLLWKGPKPEVWMLKTSLKFEAQDEYIEARSKQFEFVMKEEEEFKEKIKDCEYMTGEVDKILSDPYCTMTSWGKSIVFKAEDFWLEGEKLGKGVVLGDVLKSGDSVSAFVKEASLELDSCTYAFQATAVWKGRRHKKVLENSVEIDVPECWFLVSSYHMKKPLPRYEDTSEMGEVGVIKEIHRPKGGIISLPSGKEVWFHRTRVYVDKKKLGFREILENSLQVDDTVGCSIIPNVDLSYVDNPVEYIALLVWKGEKPDKSQHPTGNILRARVCKLDPPQETGVESGLLKISKAASMGGKKVAFNRKNVYFFGHSLEKADLAYILREGYFLFCNLEDAEQEEGVTPKASMVWIGSHSGPDITDEIRIDSPSMMSHLNKAKLDFETFQKLINGELQPKHTVQDAQTQIPPGTVLAQVTGLDPPPGEAGVETVKLTTTAGLEKIKLHRSNLYVWGICMGKADLSYVFHKDDEVLCETEEPSGVKGIKYNAKSAWVGPSLKLVDENKMEEVEKDLKFIVWLRDHSLHINQFRELVQGSMTPRMYLPFPSKYMTARVISVEPPTKTGVEWGTLLLGKGPVEGKLAVFQRNCLFVYGYNLAKGDMVYLFEENQKVFCEVELLPPEEKDKWNKKHKGQQVPTYKAVLVWIGPSRPRNDRYDKLKSGTHGGFDGWMKKRSFDLEKFKKLVDGLLPPLPVNEILVPIAEKKKKKRSVSASDGSMLPGMKGGRQISMDRMPWSSGQTQSGGMMPYQNTARSGSFMNPVTRYKNQMGGLFDAVMNIRDLNDPLLDNIIQNDDVAQMAFFISKAFTIAILRYQNRRGQMVNWPTGQMSYSGGMGMGMTGSYMNSDQGYGSGRKRLQPDEWDDGGSVRRWNRKKRQKSSNKTGQY